MLKKIPLSREKADAFIAKHHRHHKPSRGDKFRIGAVGGSGELVGVAVSGRPVARGFDDGLTIEVIRLCTDGTENACSFLYAASRRAAIEMGYTRGLTYILETESGNSLVASGWRPLGTTRGGSWDTKTRPRTQTAPTCPKKRFGWGDWPEC